MKLKKRLDKLEKNMPNKAIVVVRYGNDIYELTHGNESYLRNHAESEHDFIERIKAIVRLKPYSHDILLGNIC